MNLHACRHGGKLFLETDEADGGAVTLLPGGTAVWAPALVAGGLVRDGDRSGEQILR